MKLLMENWRRYLSEQTKTQIHIFFDMDGVLVDFAGSVAAAINNNLNRVRAGESYDEIHPESKSSRNGLKKLIGQKVQQVTPEQLEAINLKKDTGGERSGVEKTIGNYLMSLVGQGEEVWLSMKKIEGSEAMVEMAKKVAGPKNIYILSSPVDEASVRAKKKWIQNYFPNDFENRVIITGEKGAALKKLGILEKNEIAILIDDRHKYINQFHIAGGQTIYHTPAGSGGIENTLNQLQQPWSVQEPRTSSGQELSIGGSGLVLKTPVPSNIDQLIKASQEKYSQVLPEGEQFTRIDEPHVTLISGPVWKNLTFEQKQSIIKNLRLPEAVFDNSQAYLAARELEGRKTLYLKANSNELNTALKQIVKELPNKYMHLSIANVHGGDSFKSVGDINQADEGTDKKIVAAVQKAKKQPKQQQKPKGQDNPVEFAKNLAGRGLPPEQIKNIIMKKFGKPERAALGIMKGAGIQ